MQVCNMYNTQWFVSIHHKITNNHKSLQ